MSDWSRFVEEFTGRLESTGWRGLVVINTEKRSEAIGILSNLSGGNCVLATEAKYRGLGYCAREISPAGFERVLGGEFKAAIISLGGLIRPNIVAGLAETVTKGGFLAIVAPPMEQWSPSPLHGRGLYAKYLLSSIRRARTHLWVDAVSGSIVSENFNVGRPGEPESRTWPGELEGVPRALVPLARTIDQAKALEGLARFIRGRARSFMVKGDRGRGKSFTVGLAVSLAIYWGSIGRAVIVGPTPYSVSSLMKGS